MRATLADRDRLARTEAVMVAAVEAAVPALTAARDLSTASTARSAQYLRMQNVTRKLKLAGTRP